MFKGMIFTHLKTETRFLLTNVNSLHNQGPVRHFRMLPVPPVGGHRPSLPPATTDVIFVPVCFSQKVVQTESYRTELYAGLFTCRRMWLSSTMLPHASLAHPFLLLSMHSMDAFICSPRHQLMDTGVVSSLGWL